MNHTVLPLLGATLIAEGNAGLIGALAAATIFFAVETHADVVLLLALEDPEAAGPPGELDDAHAVTDPIIAAQYIKSDALLQRNLVSSNRFTLITVYGQTDLPSTSISSVSTGRLFVTSTLPQDHLHVNGRCGIFIGARCAPSEPFRCSVVHYVSPFAMHPGVTPGWSFDHGRHDTVGPVSRLNIATGKAIGYGPLRPGRSASATPWIKSTAKPPWSGRPRDGTTPPRGRRSATDAACREPPFLPEPQPRVRRVRVTPDPGCIDQCPGAPWPRWAAPARAVLWPRFGRPATAGPHQTLGVVGDVSQAGHAL